MVKILDKILDKTLDVFFSKDKTKLYVLGIFVLGLILRLIALLNLATSVDASGHALMAFKFISSGKLATWNQSVGLWYFLTDLAYKIFGTGDLGARFFVLLFGSLSVIVMFLFAKEMFNKKIGLIAAFLLAISPFHIIETIPEMDVIAMFFVLLSMLFFVKALRQDKKFLFAIAGIALGTGILIKIYVLLFIPALLLYSIYYSKKYKPKRKTFRKNILLFLFVVFIFCFVPLTYNYLLYKDKGFVDYIFTNTLGIGKEKSAQYYSWVVPYQHEYKEFIIGGSEQAPGRLPVWIYKLRPLQNSDIAVFILGILGVVFALRRKNKDYLFMFLFIMLTVFFYLGSITALMDKHFLFEVIVFAPFAAVSINKITEKIKIKHLLIVLLILILIFQLYWLSIYGGGHFYEKSSMNKLISYKLDNIPEQSLVVFDSRIFRGIGTYIFLNTHYLESNYFAQLLNNQDQIPGISQPIETYFIECLSDDCGWGTIKDQPEFNESMEDIVDFFSDNSILVKTIYKSEKEIPLSYSYNVYKAGLNLKTASLQYADSTHVFWANPVGYDENISPVFDNYRAHGILNKLLDKIAHWIFYFSVFFSIISILIVFYLLINEKSEDYGASGEKGSDEDKNIARDGGKANEELHQF